MWERPKGELNNGKKATHRLKNIDFLLIADHRIYHNCLISNSALNRKTPFEERGMKASCKDK